MAYNPNPNLYRPTVAPDTQGMGPGITAFSDNFGRYAAQGIQQKRSDERRTQDRAWQQEDQATLFGRQDARDQTLFARQDQLQATLREQQLADYGMRKDDAKEARKEEQERQLGLTLAQFGTTAALYANQGYADPAALEWASNLPREKQAAALEAIVGQASFKAQADLKQKIASQMTPVPQTDTYQMTGNGMMIPPKPTAAQQFTPEQLQQFGLRPESVTQGGVTYKAPDAPKPVRLVPKTNQDGSTTWHDPYTGQPAGAAASKTAQQYYQPSR